MARPDFVGSPAHFALQLCRRAKTAASSYIDKLMKEKPGSFREQNLRSIRTKIAETESSRRQTYIDFNAGFTLHPIYVTDVPERARIAFTRLRLSSHRLKIETGRWSRIPREKRICPCRAVQTESHVLLHCPITEPLRRNFAMLNFSDMASLMESSPKYLAIYCQRVLLACEKE